MMSDLRSPMSDLICGYDLFNHSYTSHIISEIGDPTSEIAF
jgi:hypothetical protein